MANYADINLGALKRRDVSIQSILSASGHCILYNFDTARTKWVKTEIEGNLYIFNRNTTPYYGFTLMNTKHQDNFTQVISKEMGLQLNYPYLLYKNGQGIYAVWFYEKEDSVKMFNALREYQQRVIASSSPSLISPPSSKSGTTQKAKAISSSPPEKSPPQSFSTGSILNMLNAADKSSVSPLSGGKTSRNSPRNGLSNGSNRDQISNNERASNRKPGQQSHLSVSPSGPATTGNNRKSPPSTSGSHPSAFVPIMLHRSKSTETGAPKQSTAMDSILDMSSESHENGLHPLLVQMFSTSGGATTSITTDSAKPSRLSTQATNSLISRMTASDISTTPPQGIHSKTKMISSSVTLAADISKSDSRRQIPNSANVVTPHHLAPQSFAPHPASQQFLQQPAKSCSSIDEATVSVSSSATTSRPISCAVNTPKTNGASNMTQFGSGDSKIVSSFNSVRSSNTSTNGYKDLPDDVNLQSFVSEGGVTPTYLKRPVVCAYVLISNQPITVGGVWQKTPPVVCAYASNKNESIHALQLMAPSHFMSDDEQSNSSQSVSPTSINTAATYMESPRLSNGKLSPDSTLTSAQMQQALLYLIQNDDSFMSTLHSAYMKSIAK